MEKYGKFDEEPGTCSGWNPDERTPSVEFAECMIDPFDSVRNAETEEELCEPLEEISKCEASNPKCKKFETFQTISASKKLKSLKSLEL